MFEENLQKIAPYNGPLTFLLKRISRPPRAVVFKPIPKATLVLGADCDISKSPSACVLEDDLDVLFDALHTPEWSLWLERTETRLLYLNPHNKGLFERAILWRLFEPLKLGTSRPESAFFERVHATQTELRSYFADFQDYGAHLMGHVIEHALSWNELYSLEALPLKGQPVCIVGAGPSLLSDIEKLRALKERAWIISGGSAVPTLLEHGIEPDFLIVVDSEETQKERAPYYDTLNVPALIAPRALPEVLDHIHGPRIHLSFEHPLLQRLEKKAGISAKLLDLGWSLITAAVAACQGASHMILMGVDLSFLEDRGYASSIFDRPEGSPCRLLSKNGGEVASLTKWRAERDFIASYAHARTYNAGSFGIDIPGWKNSLPSLNPIDKNYVLKEPIKTASIETVLREDYTYLIDWVWERVCYLALDFEELMGNRKVKGSLAQMIRQDISLKIEEEFSRVTVG